MRRARPIRGFTLLEILTAMAIVALMIGLMIPAIGTIQHTAQGVKQKSQFHTIEISLEAFRADTGDYPPSSYTLDSNPSPSGASADGYCGSQKLAEAIIGLDGFGFHPKSQWRSDGLIDTNGDYTGDAPIYYGAAGYAALTQAQKDENLKQRKGPYMEIEKANAVKLYQIYPTGGGFIDDILADGYVLCDMFGQTKTRSGKKIGLPILYYRADESKAYWKPQALGTAPWASSTSQDSIYNVNENYPILDYVPNGYLSGSYHLMSNRNLFYDKIKNPNFPGTAANSYREARPYRAQTFILLSAGADGLFGTADDVYNIDDKEK